MSTKNWIGTGAQGAAGSLRIVRNSDGFILDAADDTFRAVPGSEYYTPTESAANPGTYSWTLAGADWGTDTYRFYWYASAAGAGDVVVSTMTLTADEEATYGEGIRTALGMASANLDTQIAAVPAAVRDVDNTSPAAGSLGEDVQSGGTSVADMIAGGIAKESSVLGQFSVTQGIILAPSVSDNATLTVVRGDTRTLTFTLGTAWNLTSKKLWFTYAATKGGTAIGSAECTVTDAANGIGTYTPAATFFATAGRYWYDVVTTATDGTGQQTAFIGRLIVSQDVKA